MPDARGGGAAKTAVWWIRRDLRMGDNLPLAAAVDTGARVLPLFILDPELLGSRYHRAAEKRRAFLFGGLRALDADLRRTGSRLVVRSGRPDDVLAAIVRETGARDVYAEEDFGPYALRRDAAVAARVPLTLLPGVVLRHPRHVLKADGAPFTVFTAFRRVWRSLPLPSPRDLLPPPARLRPPPALESEALPAAAPGREFPPGEREARRRLEAFRAGAIHDYAAARDRLDLTGTSMLSPYLRFGMLSVREAAAVAGAAGRERGSSRGAEAWLDELGWRDFYISILHHFPSVLAREFQSSLRDIAWRRAPAGLEAWKRGETGFPVVDAAMRQLAATGWMPNRARMIVASFLVKDLLVDWREGELWFMQQLVDGDPAANNGGWQWTGGFGTDAAPYFRIFNPVLQGRRFDPRGAYVRRWVPELGRVPDRSVHEPWTMPLGIQREAGCVIGRDYPAPIVDRSKSRARTLSAYRRG